MRSETTGNNQPSPDERQGGASQLSGSPQRHVADGKKTKVKNPQSARIESGGHASLVCFDERREKTG